MTCVPLIVYIHIAYPVFWIRSWCNRYLYCFIVGPVINIQPYQSNMTSRSRHMTWGNCFVKTNNRSKVCTLTNKCAALISSTFMLWNVAVPHIVWYRAMLLFHMLFGIVQCCYFTCYLVSCNVALLHAVWYRVMLLFHMLFGIVQCCSSTCCWYRVMLLFHMLFGIVQCCYFTCYLVSWNVAHPHAVWYRVMLLFHMLFLVSCNVALSHVVWYRAMLLIHMLFVIVQCCSSTYYFGIVQCCSSICCLVSCNSASTCCLVSCNVAISAIRMCIFLWLKTLLV